MKISSLNILKINSDFNFKNQINKSALKFSSNSFLDSFTRSSDTLSCREFFDKKDKFQISDYRKLSEGSKEYIRKKANNEVQELVDLSLTIAQNLKSKLDYKYGENGYVFISIGTSPSLITKALECMGVEVRYLPISGLNMPRRYGIDKVMQNPKIFLKGYAKFLKTQGITKKSLEKDNKTYIFYDYTASGLSLERYEEMMRKCFSLPKDKARFRSINRELEFLFKDNNELLELAAKYKHKMFVADIEKYSSVAHLRIGDNLSNYRFWRKNLVCHDDPNVKMFNFLMMDRLEALGLLKENLKNKKVL